MCATCGCGKPKDKHGMKTLAEANKKGSKKLSPKQKKIAAVAGDKNKIDGADFKTLRKKAK